MNHKESESGQAGLEFVIISPVLLLAIILLAMAGRQLYKKLSAQTFAYSHCVWDLTDSNILPGTESAFSMVADGTKKTWNTEGLALYFIPSNNAISINDFDTKACLSSVTHEEWSKVGWPYSTEYDPDVLVESKLLVSRAKYSNSDLLSNGLNLVMWIKK